jgi:2-(1,2-epoxy-1,2-dihydrophenyl)acetyl-CoA isomerase
MSTVRIAYEDELALVTIDRPEQSNALDSATARALAAAIQEVSERARVVILTGEGRAFCAGGDLTELQRWNDLSEEEIGSFLYAGYQGMVRAIRASPAIVIAAVNGAAVGAGMDLALACDMRLAGESARFGQVWVRLGVIPGTGGAYLTQALAGPGKAAELLLTGDVIDAAAALQAGLVNRVVPDGELLDEARALAGRILRHPREGVVANKAAYIAATEAAVEAALAHAAAVQPKRFTSDEFRRAVRAALAR